MAGDIVRMKSERPLSMTARLEHLEDFAETAKPIITELGELLGFMRTSVKLFKTWAPIIAVLCGFSAVSNGDQAVSNIKAASSAIVEAVQSQEVQ